MALPPIKQKERYLKRFPVQLQDGRRSLVHFPPSWILTQQLSDAGNGPCRREGCKGEVTEEA